MDLLLPCAGKSSRFTTEQPKYLLTMHDGSLMFDYTTKPLRKGVERVCFAILKAHDEAFDAGRVIQKIYPHAEVLVLPEVTRGQAETVQVMLEHFAVKQPFLVKDADSYFVPDAAFDPANNYVSVCHVEDAHGARLANKSYITLDAKGAVESIVEKQVVSDRFSCGGYFFHSPEKYLAAYAALDLDQGECYLSHVINVMLKQGASFLPMPCHGFGDLGTDKDWVAYEQAFGVYLVELEGVLCQAGSQYFAPLWEDCQALPGAVEKLNALHAAQQYIVLMTSRPEEARELTVKQLNQYQIKYDQLVMGVQRGRRTLIHSFDAWTPYPAAVAINTQSNSADFVERLDSPKN